MNFFAVLFDKEQYVVKKSAAGSVPVCYQVKNLFIKPQIFLLMLFIYKLKGLYLIVTACDGLLMVFLHFVWKLLPNMRKQHIAAVLLKVFSFLAVDLKILTRTSLPHWYSNRQVVFF